MTTELPGHPLTRGLPDLSLPAAVGVQYCLSDIVEPRGCSVIIAKPHTTPQLAGHDALSPAPGTSSVGTQVDESDIALATRQSEWAELDARYMCIVRELWASHNAEIESRDRQLGVEQSLHRHQLATIKRHYRKKVKRNARAHRVELDDLRSDSRKRVRNLERATDNARRREYRHSLEVERNRYGWVLAETRIGRLKLALEAARGEDYVPAAMDVDEFPPSQLPSYVYSVPSSPCIPIPSGYPLSDHDGDIVMTDSSDTTDSE